MAGKRIVCLGCGAAFIAIVLLMASGLIHQGGTDPALKSVTEGDYSCFIEQSAAEAVKSAVDRATASWSTADVNDDGEEELILIDTTRPAGIPQPILGIFYATHGKVACAVLDFNDSTEYYFLGSDGSIVYFFNTSGAVLSSQYYRCAFTDEYDCIYTEGLAVMDFLDGTDLNGEPFDRTQWAEKHPELADMPLEGVHYLRFSPMDGTDRLLAEETDKQSFLSAYKGMAGQAFPDHCQLR